MATYNGARYLQEQLDDLAQQTRPPAELVVSDDQSSDETVAIVERFAATAPFPVRISCNPRRLGYRENFLRCAERCTSELIAFCDQDDRWRPAKLEVAASYFADDEVLLVHHNADVIAADGSRLGTLRPPRLRYAVLPPLASQPWAFAVGFTQLFRRSLLGFSDLWEMSQDQWHAGERLAHDQWFYFLASVLGRVVYLPSRLAGYRQHERNVFGWSRMRPGSQILPSLRNGADSYALCGRAAAARAQILDLLGEGQAGPWKVRARAGAAAYGALAARQTARAALYRAGSVSARTGALRNLLAMGAYGGTSWHLGRYDLAKDLGLGLSGYRLPASLGPRAASGPRA